MVTNHLNKSLSIAEEVNPLAKTLPNDLTLIQLCEIAEGPDLFEGRWKPDNPFDSWCKLMSSLVRANRGLIVSSLDSAMTNKFDEVGELRVYSAEELRAYFCGIGLGRAAILKAFGSESIPPRNKFIRLNPLEQYL